METTNAESDDCSLACAGRGCCVGRHNANRRSQPARNAGRPLPRITREQRSEITARIAAGEDDKTIASALGVPRNIVSRLRDRLRLVVMPNLTTD